MKRNTVLFKEPNSSVFQIFDTGNNLKLWDSLYYIWECKIALWPPNHSSLYESEWFIEGVYSS